MLSIAISCYGFFSKFLTYNGNLQLPCRHEFRSRPRCAVFQGIVDALDAIFLRKVIDRFFSSQS